MFGQRSEQQPAAELFDQYLKQIPLWLLPLLVALFLFLPVKELTIPTDGLLYLSQALGLYQGQGYIDPDWTPVIQGRIGLPALIAAFFWLFNFSTFSAFLLTRLFFVLTPMVIYSLGVRLFNKWVGLAASLLVLSSVSLNEWATYIHLDHIMPFFMVLFLLVAFLALERSSFWWFALAGLALGFGVLVKEIALLFAPVPAMSWLLIKPFRTRKNFGGVVVLMSVLALVVLPMFIYSYTISTDNQQTAVTGAVNYVGFKLAQDSNTTTAVLKRYLQVFPNYYTTYLSPNFTLAPFMVLAWGFTLVRAFTKREKSYLFISSAALLLLAIVIFQGTVGFRERQSVIIFLLSYLVLANFLVNIGQYLFRVVARHRVTSELHRLGLVTGLLLTAVAIIYQLQFEEVRAGTMANFVGRYNSWQSLTQRDTTRPLTSAYDQDVRPVGDWLIQHVPAGAHILTDLELQAAIYFFAQGQFPIYRQDYPDVVNVLRSIAPTDEKGGANPQHSEDIPTPLFFWFRANQTISLEHRQLYVGLEQNLLNDIREKSIDYVIVTPTLNFWALYYLNNPYFLKVADFNNGDIQIFKVLNPQPFPFHFTPSVETNTPAALRQMRRNFPHLYRAVAQDFMVGYLNWEPQQFERMVEGQYPLVQTNQRLQTRDLLTQWLHRDPAEIQSALQSYQTQSEQYPHNPWPRITIGTIHLTQQDGLAALEAFQEAIELSPNESQLYLLLAGAYARLGRLQDDQTLYEQALSIYRQALKLSPHDSHLQEAILDAISLLKEQFPADNLPPDLVALIKEIIAANPDNASAYLELADIYVRSGQPDQAIEIYIQVAAGWPERAVIAYLSLGQVYEATGQNEAAIAAYERAIALRPNLTGAYVRLGNLYLTQNKTAVAIELYHQAATNNPETAWPHLQLGKLYLERAEQK